MEVQTSNGQKIKVLEIDNQVSFVNDLDPGTKYQVKLTAKNKHGRSKPLQLDVETFLFPSELIAETKVKEDTSIDDKNISIVPVLVTCLVVLVTAMILLLIFLIRKSRNTVTNSSVSTTLLPKCNSMEQENLTASLDCESSFLYSSDNWAHSQV